MTLPAGQSKMRRAAADLALAERPAMGERWRRVRDLLSARRLDAVLVSDPYDVRYLSGFTGDDTYLIIGHEAGLICTDSRYWAQVADEVTGLELVRTERLLEDTLAAVAAHWGKGVVLGFQGTHLSYATYRRLRRLHSGGLRTVGDAVTALRQVKDGAEVARIRRAAQLTDAALQAVVEAGLVGRSERDVAWQIERELHERGAQGLAFPSIVASGAWGALPHATPRDRPIERNELVVIDTGATFDGYRSDITRTLATGELDEELRHVYEVVLRAQQAGLAAVRGGVDGKAVDAAARTVITEAGYGEYFGHGTGHGVGLEIHELPRLGRLRGDPLAAGMVVTVEPGIYLEGRGGVRIEDTVLVTNDGCEILTAFPKELRVVA